MTENVAAQGGDALPAADAQPSAFESNAPKTFSDASEAARYLASLAVEKKKQAQAADAPKEPKQEAQPAQAEEQVSGEQPDGEQETAPAEEATEAIEAESEPPIEPPRSWPKEDKEHFASLDRKTQEILARREQERDRHFLRGQNESAEQRKATEAERQQAEQLRQHYEAQLPLVVQALQTALNNEFSDIRTPEDIQRLAREDFARYVQWDAKQKQLAQWQAEAQAAHQRQSQQVSEQLQSWVKAQDEEVEQALAKVPESERQTLANEAKNALIDYGFSEEQIVQLWNSSILRSAPLQRMMADAARYRIARRNASQKTVAKPVPVQKPGTTAQPKTTALDAQIKALESKPNLKLQEATQLLELKAQRRRASAA